MGRVADSVQYEDNSQIEVHSTYDALGRVYTVSNPARPGDALSLLPFADAGQRYLRKYASSNS